MFFLEVIIGQYTSEGGITCWEKICPLFAGEYGTEVSRGLVFLGSANAYCAPTICQVHWSLTQAGLAHGGSGCSLLSGVSKDGRPSSR